MLNAIDTPLQRPSHTLTEKQLAAVAEYKSALAEYDAATKLCWKASAAASDAANRRDDASQRVSECQMALGTALTEGSH